MNKKSIINDVENYYSDKLKKFGSTSRGVDWNSEESQEMRFKQLLNVVDFNSENNISILDYGCGFGAMFPFINKNYKSDFNFIGYDISDDMIEKAKQLFGDNNNTDWINKLDSVDNVDYTIASGIFNVQLNHKDSTWIDYILDILHQFNDKSKKGFSFNMLTSYSDKEYMRDYLYYADPAFFFNYCKKHFSKYVSVLHDYPLYEFTIIVRKY